MPIPGKEFYLCCLSYIPEIYLLFDISQYVEKPLRLLLARIIILPECLWFRASTYLSV